MHAPANPAERDKKLRRDSLDSIRKGVCLFVLFSICLNTVAGVAKPTAIAAGHARGVQNALNRSSMHALCAARGVSAASSVAGFVRTSQASPPDVPHRLVEEGSRQPSDERCHSADTLANSALQATVWGDKADPDKDGRDNLLEYALGLDPLKPDSKATDASDFGRPLEESTHPSLITGDRRFRI
jgi:hypothetical protein